MRHAERGGQAGAVNIGDAHATDGERGVLGQRLGARHRLLRSVVDRGDGERDVPDIGAAEGIGNGVVEIDGAVEVRVRGKAQRPIGVHRQRALGQRDRMGGVDGLAIDLRDVQRVVGRVGVVGTRIEGDGGIFNARDRVVLGHWRQVGTDSDVDVAHIRSCAVGHGVGEVDRAAEGGQRVEVQCAIRVQTH